MNVSTDQLQIISRIYDVLMDPTQWTSVLDDLDAQIGSKGCNVFLADPIMTELTSMSFSTKLAPLIEYYVENGFNKLDEAVLPRLKELMPERGFKQVNKIYSDHNNKFGSQLDCCELENWIRINWGVHHRYTTLLNGSAPYLGIATFQLGRKSKSELNDSLSQAEIYIPHLSKVVEISRPFHLLQTRFQAILTVLDRFHLGVFILTPKGSIVVSNQAATRITELADGLLINSQKKLYCRNTSINAKLLEAIHYVHQLSDGQENNQSLQLAIPRVGDASPYLIELSALHSKDIELSGGFKGILVTIIDPDHNSIINTSGLEILYGLTEAEQDVCRLLVDGHNTNEIAELRNSKIETIRSQIKSLLSKTNSSQRTELVKLALSINLPIDTT